MLHRDESWPRGDVLAPESQPSGSMRRRDRQSRRARVRSLAYRLWQERGSPLGSPDVDWFQAEQQLGIRPRAVLPLFAFGIERLTS